MRESEILITLLNMSFAGSIAAVIVICLRIFMKKMPKVYSYVLWAFVFFRLICPFTLETSFNPLPVNMEPISKDIIFNMVPAIESGVFLIDKHVNDVLAGSMAVTHPEYSVNPIQVFLGICTAIWFLGFIIVVGYNLLGCFRLSRRLSTAVKIEEGVYESEWISGPCALGVLRPAAYLPFGLTPLERLHILGHERAHIKRKDYLVKSLAFLVLSVHWFNPMAWISYWLMCKDMEMSCDELVMKELGLEEKQSYSKTLLHFSEIKSGLRLPLAFGESHTKSRIRNILKYKKPGFWAVAAAVILILCAALTLLTGHNNSVNSISSFHNSSSAISVIGGADGPTSIFIAGKLGSVEENLSEPVDSGQLSDIMLEAPVEPDHLSKDMQFLFTADGYDYYVREPLTYLSWENPGMYMAGRKELIRIIHGEIQVLDNLVSQGVSLIDAPVILAGERIVYSGAARAVITDIKSPTLISIRLDGTGRRSAEDISYGVASHISLDGEELYYEGWTNDNKFPRPIYRLSTDFTKHDKIGEIDGSLITVRDGNFYYLNADSEKTGIYISRLEEGKKTVVYDKCGFDAAKMVCTKAMVSGSELRMEMVSLEDHTNVFSYTVNLADTDRIKKYLK